MQSHKQIAKQTMSIEIYDCTLREGEQAAGASFNFQDRIKLFKKLDDLGVDYIELGWPIASEDILKSFHECEKILKNSKIVAFGSTSTKENPEEDKNLQSILDSRAKFACIFGKSWLEHVDKQLNITPEENIERIKKSIKFLKNKNIKVFYDAEHFFDGFLSNKDYAIKTLVEASRAGAERLILCDTNGGIFPDKARQIVQEVREHLDNLGIKTPLGVHFHNDRGLALASALSCLEYIKQVQGTINGRGERIGNLNLSEFLPNYESLGFNLNIDLKKLKETVEEAFRSSGIPTPGNMPFVGKEAFAHKGGIHQDAINKGASYEHSIPEEYGNKRVALLNTLGGTSSVVAVARHFGHEIDKKDEHTREKIENLFKELREYEKEGYRIEALPAEQFLLIEKYFGNLKEYIKIDSWKIETGMHDSKEKSKFIVNGEVENNPFKTELEIEGGPINAAFKTLKNLLIKNHPEVENLHLSDYHVEIAKRSEEASTVRTAILFKDHELFEVVGVSENIIDSSILALCKGFKYYLNKTLKEQKKNVFKQT